MKFYKVIEQQFIGLACASVYDSNGKLVGREMFGVAPWRSQEGNLKKAHKWADKWMATCEKYCMDGRPESVKKAGELFYENLPGNNES